MKSAIAIVLLLTSACAEWPQYYYRKTPAGTTVVPASGGAPVYYRTQPTYAPRSAPPPSRGRP